MNRKIDDLPVTRELGQRLRSLDQARKFAALRSRIPGPHSALIAYH
jgi:hypothetical protein